MVEFGGTKWRKASHVMYDKRTQMRLKAKFYKSVMKQTILYDLEQWRNRDFSWEGGGQTK